MNEEETQLSNRTKFQAVLRNNGDVLILGGYNESDTLAKTF